MKNNSTFSVNNETYTIYLQNEDRDIPRPHILNEDSKIPDNQKKILREYFILEGNKYDENWTTYDFIRQADAIINQKPLTEYATCDKPNNNFGRKELEKYHEEVLNDEKYGAEYRLIKNIFKAHPCNNDINTIAMKAAVIDVTNSTHLSLHKKNISLVNLATVICNIEDFDEKLKNGDPKLVEEIAGNCKEKFDVNLFSFASKYCHYHNLFVYGKDDYPIFDNLVSENLHKFSPHCKKTEPVNWRKNIDYISFKKHIDEILTAHGITPEDTEKKPRTKFDHFVWKSSREN